MSVEENVRPYFVGDDNALIFAEYLHRFFKLILFPYSAAGIVRTAKDDKVNAVLSYAFVHILIVHPPYAVFVLPQRAQLGDSACIFQHMCKADIGGAVQQYLLAGCGERLNSRADAAEHAVFVADVLGAQARYTVALFVPADDAVVIFLCVGCSNRRQGVLLF